MIYTVVYEKASLRVVDVIEGEAGCVGLAEGLRYGAIEAEAAPAVGSTLAVDPARAEALAATTFTKLQIRRAMRALGTEPQLDALLASSASFASDWADAQDIDTGDPLTAQALAAASIDIAAVKLQIAGLL